MEKVTISRHWDNPHIRVEVNDTEINLSIMMDKFMYALMQEMDLGKIRDLMIQSIGSVTWVLTKDEIAKRITRAFYDVDIPSRIAVAAHNVIAKVKEESTKVM